MPDPVPSLSAGEEVKSARVFHFKEDRCHAVIFKLGAEPVAQGAHICTCPAPGTCQHIMWVLDRGVS